MATRVGLQNFFNSAPYVEAMLQMWWSSVHKWRHSLVYSRRRPDNGDWRSDTQIWKT